MTERAGDAGGRAPLVLIGESAADFAFVEPILARRGPVASTALQADGLDADRVADAVERVAPRGPVTLLGYGVGAAAAIALAADNPRVTQLVLVAGSAAPSAKLRMHARILGELEDSPALQDHLAFARYGEEHLASRPRTQADPASARRLAGFAASLDVTALLPRVTATTLVVGCTADQLVPERHSMALAAGLPDARYASLDSAHAVLEERPAELLSLVDAFLDEPARHPAGSTVPRMRP